MIYIQLFIQFFKVGLFAIGGGLATLPFLYNMAKTTQWFSAADVSNMIAVSESTPGAIGINMATYAGYQTSGILGGLCATIGLITPSIIIILIIARVLEKFKNSKYVERAFFGLRPASLAMIAAAGATVAQVALFRDMKIYIPSILLGICIYALSKKTKLGVVPLICIGAFIGIVFQFAGM